MGVGALLGQSASASLVGGTLLSDNFDGYADQAAFQAVWPAIASGSPNSCVLSTAQSVSSPNGVQVPGTATSNQYRNRRSFSESGTIGIGDQIVWSYDFYDANPTGAPARNYCNLQDSTAPVATNQLIAMGMNNNESATDSGGQFYMARILGYSPPTVDPDGGPNETGTLGAGAFFKLNDYAAGARALGWHNFKVVITTDDALSTDFQFFVDNTLAETVNNVGTAATIRSYDNIALGSGVSNASVEADFDNQLLQLVSAPEPSSFVMLGLSAGLLLRRGRRRNNA